MTQFKFRGVVDEAMRFVAEEQLLQTDLWKRFVQQFREDADYDAGWRGEFWGKMMRGACFVYSYSKDGELYQVLTNTVKDMLCAQEESGRVSSYDVSHEFDGWDIWGRKYVLLGMQYYMEICKDEGLSAQILDSMCRQVDYIIQKIGKKEEGKKPIAKATRHWRGVNSCSLLEPIVRLYNLTQEQKYFDFATYIVECGGTDVVNLFELAYEDKLYPYQYPVTKAYEMTSCFEGLLEYYRVTENERYKTSVVNYANRILESDFTIVGGSGCTNEMLDHSTVRQANTNNDKIMQETCVVVTMMKFFYQLTLSTGDSKYVDAFETSLYNIYLGSLNTDHAISPIIYEKHPDCQVEMMPFDSYSPLTAGIRGNGIGGLKLMSDNHYYGCCACIGAAGIGLVPKMALINTQTGYAINLFISGSIETVTKDGQKLTFVTDTQYPKTGEVKISIDIKRSETFEILIRIPSWSKQTVLLVNGENVLAQSGYVKIERTWACGDELELHLDMRTECIRPIPYGSQVLMTRVIWGENFVAPTYDEEDPMAKHHMALRRGPIILAQENRLGYSVEEPVDILVKEDGYVDAVITDGPVAPYACLVEMEIPLKDGTMMHVTDYASAGKTWTEESKMAAWMLTK